MARYTVYLHFDLLDTMPSGGYQRRKILEFIRGLQAQPNVLGDFMESDDFHRLLRTKIVGKYAVTYWLDDAAQAVVITKVQPAG